MSKEARSTWRILCSALGFLAVIWLLFGETAPPPRQPRTVSVIPPEAAPGSGTDVPQDTGTEDDTTSAAGLKDATQGGEVVVRVRAEDGRQVAARVAAIFRSGRAVSVPRVARGFVFARDGVQWIHASANGLASRFVNMSLSPSHTIDVTLSSDAPVLGRVRTADGLPVARCEVVARPVNQSPAVTRFGTTTALAKTNGEFRIARLSLDITYVLSIRGLRSDAPLLRLPSNEVRIIADPESGIVMAGPLNEAVRWQIASASHSVSGYLHREQVLVPVGYSVWKLTLLDLEGALIATRTVPVTPREPFARIDLPAPTPKAGRARIRNETAVNLQVVLIRRGGDVVWRGPIASGREHVLALDPDVYVGLGAGAAVAGCRAVDVRAGSTATISFAPGRARVAAFDARGPNDVRFEGLRLQLEGQGGFTCAGAKPRWTSGWFAVEANGGIRWSWGSAWIEVARFRVLLPKTTGGRYQLNAPGFKPVSGRLDQLPSPLALKTG